MLKIYRSFKSGVGKGGWVVLKNIPELRPKHFKMNKFLDGVILLVRPPLYLLNSLA